MSKRTQKESGEERVTAKSEPMMNLVSRCSERNHNVLASIASESSGKTRYESQIPLSSRTEQHHRMVRPVVFAHSSSYSEWNVDETWSSQEWKSDELMDDRTERLGNEQPPGLFAQHTDRFIVDDDDMDSDTVTESDLSLGSRSFLNRVNDQVRKRQKTILKRCNRRQRRTFCDMVNVYVFNIASICIYVEELLRQLTFHQKYRRSHNETDVRHIREIGIRTIR